MRRRARRCNRFGETSRRVLVIATLLGGAAGATEPPRRANRLAGESSPYLLLHQHNPVDWYPWGPEALARAKSEDKPIFLSVGYSSCYWCHVMERESFSDPKIAELLNREFVCIKVDREERPELDEIYMTATQLLTRQGGWPNSVFLTPKLEPFFAGTYFPPEDRDGRQGFATVAANLAQNWKQRRPVIERQAGKLAEAMRQVLEKNDAPAAAPPPAKIADEVLGEFKYRFDPVWGGFGPAPKFPFPSNFLFLLELPTERPRAAEMLRVTLEKMARGGIYDQLGGGFHRYSTDPKWQVPHFEKMLYDNALLLEVYARFAASTGNLQAKRIARETAAFLERELSDPAGGFWSAIDASTEGEEGAFYVWSRTEIDAALGPSRAAALAPILGFDGEPNFEGGRFVLTLPKADEAQLTEIAAQRRELLAARGRRKRPPTDDKVLADWNGLAIAGLAVTGQSLGEPALVERAARAARFVLAELRPAGGTLQHVWRGGKAKIPAFLADYVYLVRGLLALHAANGERVWLDAAVALQGEQTARLGAPSGGFFDAAEQPDVLFRLQEAYDSATPAPNAVAVLNLLELAARTGEKSYRERAESALRAFAARLERSPAGAPTLALAVLRFHQPVPSSPKIDQKAP